MPNKVGVEFQGSPTGRTISATPEFQRLPLFPQAFAPKNAHPSFFKQDFSQLEARVSAFMASQQTRQSSSPKK